MPIVDIELVVEQNKPVAVDLAQSMADAVGRALESPRVAFGGRLVE